MCRWNEGLFVDNFTPSEVTVTLISGNLRASQTFHPTYKAYQVNGPGCGPDCRAATVVFTTPLDTSPKAIAQTATVRPLMLVINQALLQATMLAATAQALNGSWHVSADRPPATRCQGRDRFAPRQPRLLDLSGQPMHRRQPCLPRQTMRQKQRCTYPLVHRHLIHHNLWARPARWTRVPGQ